MKLTSPSQEHLEKHYADLAGKGFFKGLISCEIPLFPDSFPSPPRQASNHCLLDMLSGPICAMVWEGKDAVKTGRTILGATNPLASAPGTIRGDYAIDVGRNVCHDSDSVENAKKEIALWFSPSEVLKWKATQAQWVYE